MVNFGPLAAEITSLVWGTPANFNRFHVLAALLHSTLVVGVSQTLRRWTEGASYIRQGGHHVRHWPTFLIVSVLNVPKCIHGAITTKSQPTNQPPQSNFMPSLKHHLGWSTIDMKANEDNQHITKMILMTNAEIEIAPLHATYTAKIGCITNQWCIIYHKDQLSLTNWQTCTMHCITTNVQVEAQCDELAIELSWQRFVLKVANFQLPHMQLVPRLGATPFEFWRDFWHPKTRVPGLSCGIVCVILRLAVSVEHRLVTNRWTDGHTRAANTCTT